MKIVYNACHGGFSLSREAVLRARKISGNPAWGGPAIVGDKYVNGDEVNDDYGHIDGRIERFDPILVQVVEELGSAANGRYARLKVEEVPAGTKYIIHEYDGLETVMTPDDFDWEIAT